MDDLNLQITSAANELKETKSDLKNQITILNNNVEEKEQYLKKKIFLYKRPPKMDKIDFKFDF